MSPLTPTHETAEQPPPSRPGPVHPGSTTAAATDHQPSNYPPPPAVLSHANHPHRPQTIAPPPPVPLDFENNPDAIALKSAISILQMQSRRAADDIRTLNRAKQDALEHPEEFISDLTAAVAPSSKREQEQADDDNSSSSSDDEDASGHRMLCAAHPSTGRSTPSSATLSIASIESKLPGRLRPHLLSIRPQAATSSRALLPLLRKNTRALPRPTTHSRTILRRPQGLENNAFLKSID
jgi:hypothetical protein